MPERKQIKEIHLTLAELAKKLPSVEEWFSDPTHRSVKIEGQQRLLTVEERLALFGGEDAVKEYLGKLLKEKNPKPLILHTCLGPMTGYEIGIYLEKLGRRISVGELYINLIRLCEPEKESEEARLRRVNDIARITRLGENEFAVLPKIGAYVTTDKGFESLKIALSTNK